MNETPITKLEADGGVALPQPCSAIIPRVLGKPMRWKKRMTGLYARNGDLLTMRTAEQLIEELQDEIIAMQNDKTQTPT